MTIELRTGISRPPRREDMCTKVAGCTARDIPIPIWCAFLDRVTAKDKDLQAYLQRVAGYCLTGVTTEHSFSSSTAPVPTARASSSTPCATSGRIMLS